MAASYITKTHKTKKGETKTIKYRVDADFIPSSVKEICEEFIQNYVVANGETDWLVEQYQMKETATVKKEKANKKVGDTYEQDKSFVSIRAAFVDKFFADIRVGEKAEDSARNKFLAKYAK